MKKYVLVLISGIFILLSSCGKKASDEINIRITISNPVDNIIIISRADSKFEETPDTLHADEKGVFNFTYTSLEPAYFAIKHDKVSLRIYARPGELLDIESQGDSFAHKISFQGKSKLMNDYLKESFLSLEKEIDLRSLLFENEKDFIRITDSIYEANIMLLDNFLALLVKPDIFFRSYEESFIKYSRAYQRIVYKRYARYYAYEDEFVLSNTYDDYLAELDFENPELLKVEYFKSFIAQLVQTEAELALAADQSLPQGALGKIQLAIDFSMDRFKNPYIRSYALYSAMHDHLKYRGIEDATDIIAFFKENCVIDKYLEDIDAIITSWERLQSGKQAPDFTAHDLDGKKYDLSSFAGKYLYIDVWASWCGPCLREIPFMTALYEEIKDKNINIVAISVDDDVNIWIDFIAKKESAYMQLYAEGFKSMIAQNYNIFSIPRFILISPDGKIINANAPRPSGNIREVLLDLEGI